MMATKTCNKKLILSIMFAFVCIMVTVLSVNIFIPSFYYNRGLSLIEKGDYEAAYCNLRVCKTYKNSQSLLENFGVNYDKIITYEYDENNNLTSYTEEIFENDKIISRKTYKGDRVTYNAEYKYNEQGDMIFYAINREGDTVQSGTHKYEYDKNGNMLTDEFYFLGELDCISKYTYDDKGYLMMVEITNSPNDNPWQEITTINYTKDGALREVITYETDGSVQNTLKETYDKNGVLRYSVNYFADGTKSYENTYDEYGNTIEFLDYNFADGGMSKYQTTYEYDENGAKIKQYVRYGGEIETFRLEYKYGTILNTVVSSKYENGKLKSDRHTLYDKNGNELKSVLYEYLSGKKIKQAEYTSTYDRFGNKLTDEDDMNISNEYKYTYDRNGVYMTSYTLYYNSFEDNTRMVIEYVNPRFVYAENTGIVYNK